MKRQRNIAQMKEQTRNTQDQTKKRWANYLEKEFKTMIAKMFQNLKNRIKKIQEAINTINIIMKYLKEMNKQMNNTITDLKYYRRKQ